MTPFEQLKVELKEKVPLGIDIALQALKSVIPNNVPRYNELLILESRYQNLNENLVGGLMEREKAEVGFNILRKDILLFISDLKEDDFVKEPTEQAAPKPRMGKVLKRIPNKMQLNKEVKCVIRVAFNEALLMTGLEEDANDAIKEVRVANVMSVEMLDPSESQAFSIKGFSESIQRIFEDDFTEWLFYVKPLLEGEHVLLVKVAVVELIDGRERKREIVLEEIVQVITTAPEATSTTAFVETAHTLAVAGGKGKSSKNQKARGIFGSFGMSKATELLVGLAVVAAIIAYFLWPPDNLFGGGGKGNSRKKDTAISPPTSEVTKEIEPQKDILEQWETVKTSDSNAIKSFIEKHPDFQPALDSLETLRLYLAYKQQGDSLLFIIAGGVLPNNFTLLQKNKPFFTQKLNNRDAVLNIPNLKYGVYEAQLTDATGKSQTIKVEYKAPSRPTTITPSSTPTPPRNPTPTPPTPAPTIVDFKDLESPPIYQGCNKGNKKRQIQCTENAIQNYMLQQLNQMPEIRNKTAGSRVSIVFIVQEDGRVTAGAITTEQSVAGFNNKIKKIVESMPRFTPGKDKSGNLVSARYLLPLRFEL
ncbi:MAG TPA: hypothetical protein PKD70_00835 [Saprospiraceae bacterium]|nr:hypothetical protein [Saprospiraceae bacterium]HMP12391.1 hypothetical protein [Saprospiraceae bacterium]